MFVFNPAADVVPAEGRGASTQTQINWVALDQHQTKAKLRTIQKSISTQIADGR